VDHNCITFWEAPQGKCIKWIIPPPPRNPFKEDYTPFSLPSSFLDAETSSASREQILASLMSL
jgi:hypothetical protein